MKLVPGGATLSQLESLYRSGGGPVTLDRSCRAVVETAAQRVAEAAAGDAAVYGVNTG